MFCALGGVGLCLAASLVHGDQAYRSTVSLALLMTLSAVACLYGTLVEIESAGKKSFETLLAAKRQVEAEITETEDLLHDLRSGLLSIETAMANLDDDVSGPLRTETSRLRMLTAKRKRNPVQFDMVGPVRDMVMARRTTGLTIDLRAPTSAQIVGEESEVLAIVDNLLSNAMRHGRDPIHIEIDEHAGNVNVRVTDSGRVGESVDTTGFFRRGVTTHTDGDGIGLDRARMLAELHNGWIKYVPGDNGETSFVLTLPTTKPDDTSRNGLPGGGRGDNPAVISWTPSAKT